MRHATSIEARMATLKTTALPNELMAWWNRIPATEHPLEDASKWGIDAWAVDEFPGGATAMAVVQGEFQESEF